MRKPEPFQGQAGASRAPPCADAKLHRWPLGPHISGTRGQNRKKLNTVFHMFSTKSQFVERPDEPNAPTQCGARLAPAWPSKGPGLRIAPSTVMISKTLEIISHYRTWADDEFERPPAEGSKSAPLGACYTQAPTRGYFQSSAKGCSNSASAHVR